ncbi:MAG: hypothetical protein ACI9JP_003527 [Granulosicoccus sp.]|jgi:hypothetical protein
MLSYRHHMQRGHPSLLITAFGVVTGFPLLTALALQYVRSPLHNIHCFAAPHDSSTGALRAGERLRLPFWVFSCVGNHLLQSMR